MVVDFLYVFLSCFVPILFFIFGIQFALRWQENTREQVRAIWRGEIRVENNSFEGEPMAQDMNALMWYDL